MDTWNDRSETLDKLIPALMKVQAALKPLKKEGYNPHYKSNYADLSTVLEEIRKPLEDNGLCIFQEPGSNEGRSTLATTVYHSSGQYLRSKVEFPVQKQDPQGHGSAITYARRYTLKAILLMADSDDDGNAGSGLGDKPKPTVNNRPPAPKVYQPSATPRPADNLPVKASSVAWDGNLIISGGKYKDKTWKDLPPDYLEWARHNAKSKEAQKMAELEISRREQAEMPDFEAINDEAETKRILREEASIEDTY